MDQNTRDGIDLARLRCVEEDVLVFSIDETTIQRIDRERARPRIELQGRSPYEHGINSSNAVGKFA